VWNIFDYFTVDVLGELHCSLSSTGWAHPSALTGEGDKEGVFAPVAINPGGTVSKYAAVKIFVEGL
jgi:hypothetical protein